MYHFHVGRYSRIAVMLTCPRQQEMVDGCPASPNGEVGKNLDLLLALLASSTGRSDINRSDVTITYAWPNIEYTELTGRGLPTTLQVTNRDNISRLNRELTDITELVICSGTLAEEVYPKLSLPHCPNFVCVRHISERGLATITFDINGNKLHRNDRDLARKQQNTLDRLAVVADRIMTRLTPASCVA